VDGRIVAIITAQHHPIRMNNRVRAPGQDRSHSATHQRNQPAPRAGQSLSQVVLLSLTASLNPTLVAATTVMLLLDRPARLMGGYLLGRI
jgi:hypothetical protein